MASSRLEKLLRERIGKAQPKLGKLHLQETQVLVPGSPAPSGAILPTDTGPRTLPLESYASLWFNSDTGHAVGLVQLFTIGTGAYVGGARIEYKMSWFEDGERQAARSFESDSQSGRKMELGSKMQNERLGEVRIRVLEPLWELEREVWAHRAADLGK
ncbi:hypothetical protein QQS21_008105 [Conoideocrella luteorostrata]|uniref:Uncharacterized protein n=1 Tax=Conoideocrella luteorostrata TaxID=1105319 RepID=A0AAJ0CJF9_9HYPO|nr:hypothetical protein QQS21_008105 [Conoideocrella luteorostrata]